MSETIAAPIKQINTSCKDCFFSVWKDKTQTSCSIGMVDRFKEREEVIEVYDEQGDEFFVINGRHCQYKRSRVWGHAFGTNHDLAYQKARKEISPRVELVVYLDKIDTNALQKLGTTLKSIDKTKVSLLKIVNNSLEDPAPLSAYLQKMLLELDMNDLKWSTKHIIEAADIDRCADLAIKESKNPYFLFCEAGFKFPKKALKKIDEICNDELKPLSLVKFKSGAYMGQTLLYKITGGNRDKRFINKIEDAAQENGQTELIMEFNDE